MADRAWVGGQVYSCWGTFKAFCRGKARNETVRFAGGLKCEGHWLYIKPVCDARIAVRPAGGALNLVVFRPLTHWMRYAVVAT